jgi:hypothetical protein
MTCTAANQTRCYYMRACVMYYTCNSFFAKLTTSSPVKKQIEAALVAVTEYDCLRAVCPYLPDAPTALHNAATG